MNKAEYIRQMNDEQLAEAILDCEEKMLIASCKKEYCPFYEENGGCSAAKKGTTTEQGCRDAVKKWLSSEVNAGGEWYE